MVLGLMKGKRLNSRYCRWLLLGIYTGNCVRKSYVDGVIH